jgi:hypothetical protein
MKMEQDALLNKLQSLKLVVKQSLRQKGIVVPVKTKRGLQLDDYEIVLLNDGYAILNKWKEPSHKGISYMKTAVVVANAMALKRAVKTEWLLDDKIAGYTEFDIKLFDKRYTKSAKQQDLFGMSHYSIRLSESKLKHKSHIANIDSTYLRLLNAVKSVEKSAK